MEGQSGFDPKNRGFRTTIGDNNIAPSSSDELESLRHTGFHPNKGQQQIDSTGFEPVDEASNDQQQFYSTGFKPVDEAGKEPEKFYSTGFHRTDYESSETQTEEQK